MLTRSSGRIPSLPPAEAGDTPRPNSVTTDTRPTPSISSSALAHLHHPIHNRHRLSHALTLSSFAQPRPIMSRAAGNRPTHIPLPNSPFGGRSPNGSPLPTPSQGPTSPTSPRSSFIPSFIRTRSRAATLTGGRGRSSPSAEVTNPLAAPAGTGSTSQRPGSSGQSGVGVTRSISTPQTGGLAGPCISQHFIFPSLSSYHLI
jgi:hypothetical protein